MPAPDPATDLVRSAADFHCSLSSAQASALLTWRDRLLEENRVVNLTGVRNPEDATTRLILDSLAIGLHLRDRASDTVETVLDFGSGGGVPGVPMATAWPGLRVVLVESRRRKTDAMARIMGDVGPQNAHVLHGRLDELRAQDSDLDHGFDLVTSKAVGTLGAVVEQTAELLRPGGALVVWKGHDLDSEERDEGRRAARSCGLRPLDDIAYEAYRPSRLIRYLSPGVEHG